MEATGTTPHTWVDAPDLAELVRSTGPFLSTVLALEVDVEQAAQKNRLRWRAKREAAAEAGAPEELLSQVDRLVDEAHLEGRALALIATPEAGPVHVAHWADPPRLERCTFGPVPSLAPMISRRQRELPHMTVVADRSGADICAIGEDGREVRAQAGDRSEVVRKVKVGGWSHRRYLERAENSWEQNADDVAERIGRLARVTDPRFILLAGDVRAVQMIQGDLPKELAPLVHVVDGSRATDGSPGIRREDIDEWLAVTANREEQQTLDKLREELGQHDRAVAGVGPVVEALRSGQVLALLLGDDPADERTLLIGEDPMHVATSADELSAMGSSVAVEARLDDALIRAALGSGAGVRVLMDTSGVDQGVAALLRWA